MSEQFVEKAKELGYDVYSTSEAWERLRPSNFGGIPIGFNHPKWKSIDSFSELFDILDIDNQKLQELK